MISASCFSIVFGYAFPPKRLLTNREEKLLESIFTFASFW